MTEANPAPGSVPQGVRLRCEDGRVVECDLVRDEHGDRPGLAYYMAVPRESVELGTYVVEVDVLPPHSGFWVDIPAAGPGLSALGTPQ